MLSKSRNFYSRKTFHPPCGRYHQLLMTSQGRSQPQLVISYWWPARAVASLTVSGGQEFHFPHFFPKFWSFFLIFPQTFVIFFLILALRVGDSPTREGPGYATVTSRWTPWWCFYSQSVEEVHKSAITDHVAQNTPCHWLGGGKSHW